MCHFDMKCKALIEKSLLQGKNRFHAHSGQACPTFLLKKRFFTSFRMTQVVRP